MANPARRTCLDRYEYSEIAHWLAEDPDRLAEVLDEHYPAGGECVVCHHLWPCGMHRHARAALLLP